MNVILTRLHIRYIQHREEMALKQLNTNNILSQSESVILKELPQPIDDNLLASSNVQELDNCTSNSIPNPAEDNEPKQQSHSLEKDPSTTTISGTIKYTTNMRTLSPNGQIVESDIIRNYEIPASQLLGNEGNLLDETESHGIWLDGAFKNTPEEECRPSLNLTTRLRVSRTPDQHGSTSVNDQHGSASTNDQHGSASANDQHGSASANDQHGSASANDQHGSASANDQHGSASANDQHGSASANDQHGSASANDQHRSASANDQQGIGLDEMEIEPINDASRCYDSALPNSRSTSPLGGNTGRQGTAISSREGSPLENPADGISLEENVDDKSKLNVAARDDVRKLRSLFETVCIDLDAIQKGIPFRDFEPCGVFCDRARQVPQLIDSLLPKLNYSPYEKDLLKARDGIISVLDTVQKVPAMIIMRLVEFGFYLFEIGNLLGENVLPACFAPTVHSIQTRVHRLSVGRVVRQIIYVPSTFDPVVSTYYKDRRLERIEKFCACNVRLLPPTHPRAALCPPDCRTLEVDYDPVRGRHIGFLDLLNRCMHPKLCLARIATTIMRRANGKDVELPAHVIEGLHTSLSRPRLVEIRSDIWSGPRTGAPGRGCTNGSIREKKVINLNTII